MSELLYKVDPESWAGKRLGPRDTRADGLVPERRLRSRGVNYRKARRGELDGVELVDGIPSMDAPRTMAIPKAVDIVIEEKPKKKRGRKKKNG